MGNNRHKRDFWRQMDWELRSGLTVYLHAFDSVICFSEPFFFFPL